MFRAMTTTRLVVSSPDQLFNGTGVSKICCTPVKNKWILKAFDVQNALHTQDVRALSAISVSSQKSKTSAGMGSVTSMDAEEIR